MGTNGGGFFAGGVTGSYCLKISFEIGPLHSFLLRVEMMLVHPMIPFYA